MQEECKLIVAQLMPQLTKLLLETDEKDDTYAYCLEYAVARVESYAKPLNSAERVWNNLADFVDRYLCEQLPILADTIKTLANVIIDDKSITEDLKVALLDFLLSVNYKAFRSARIHYEHCMTRRKEILETLTASQASSDTPREFNLATFRHTLDSKLSSCRDAVPKQEQTEASTSRTISAQTLQTRRMNELVPTKNYTSMVTRANAAYAQQPEEPRPGPVDCNTLARCSEVGAKCRFAVAYGSYLRRRFNNATENLQLYGEEGFVMREILGMFFLPGDCHNFKVVNHLLQLRPNIISDTASEQLVLEKFVKPMQYMQMLHLYINSCETPYTNGERLLILNSLTGALRRLVKPVVESLTQFERSLDTDEGNQLSLRDFRRATKRSFMRLELLWSLAAATYISYPEEFGQEPHSRSQHIFCSLVELSAQTSTAEEQERRAYSAALLLHVLHVLCRFLDNWWQLGEFNDWHEEFPVQRLEHNGRTEYVMRTFDNGQPYMKICPVYQLIERHVVAAGAALAALYDSKRLPDFVSAHETLLGQSLHHALVKSVHGQLQYYQKLSTSRCSTGVEVPDIFWQLNSTEDEQLRCLYYVYHQETHLDETQPGCCSIDELLSSCQSCVVYAPLDELICQTLERHLEQRATLLNSYLGHLIRDQMQLVQLLQQLRAVYLLLHFEQFAQQYELAVGSLERGLSAEAAEQLQSILDMQNLRPNYPFYVHVPGAKVEQLTLHYSYDIALTSIITEPQLRCYNAAFRLRLQLHVAVHRLQQLPQLPDDQEVSESLLQLQQSVLHALHQHFRLQQLQRAAELCDERLQRRERLSYMQATHQAFVQTMSASLQLSEANSGEEMCELLAMARIVVCLWRRVAYTLAHNMTRGDLGKFESYYQRRNLGYLGSVNKSSEAMRYLTLLPHFN
ncbi:uncharacterized protein LOC115766974 [Drosophila novamexicana]|uniref:uncharacterized protein LOC115766974 n=1 Tax=Drosophila novamexicana TaxID=47314 RepID=UPI0011E5B0B4|nr:uncharacterized protein LOC115766974 [Drosophila novamexicana]